MLIVGAEHIPLGGDGAPASGKMVFNAAGAIIFPVLHQHRDMKAVAISYEDNYEGNALAAMLSPWRIEIRYHARFTDSAVERILSELLRTPELSPMRNWQATYQGRLLNLPNS